MAARDEPLEPTLSSSETRLLMRLYNCNDFAWLGRERIIDVTKVSNVFPFITTVILAFNCYE